MAVTLHKTAGGNHGTKFKRCATLPVDMRHFYTRQWTHNDLVRILVGPGNAMRFDVRHRSLGARQEPVDIGWK
ncbi:hypothetical protein DPMN_181216 [Dreissena polymorpha]|uniref:Uncharacterized protein n=1 Tax=Dreissena polymorpha TaxID=45954 RepID=A0A9D4I3H8_DREPO|nr:hypothetical protein DPMN_181216 [Dreissena polymorpha]